MKTKLALTIIVAALLLFSVTIPVNAKAESGDTLGGTLEEVLDSLDLSEIEDYFNSLGESVKAIFKDGFYERIRGMLGGDYSGGAAAQDDFLSALLELALGGVYALLPLFASIIGIAALGSILSASRPNLLKDGTGELVFFVSYAAVLLLVLTCAFTLIESTQSVIRSMGGLLDAVLPILLALMTAAGNASSVAVFGPTCAFLGVGVVNLIASFVFPLITATVVFSVVGNLSKNLKLTKFCEFFASLIKWTLGITLSAYTIYLSASGSVSAVADGISLRAAKYAISSSVPIVGGFLKEGFDLVVASCVLIKNSIGGFSVLIILATIVEPLINILAFVLLLNLTAAIVEPICDVRLGAFLSGLSKSISYLAAALLVTAMMFIVTLFLLIVCANSVF